ncbi:MAG: hypothetical protein KF821_02095 [Anaerolineales bacterium]|nr:hypothetical protein [Anaerolineales bacterium]
MQQNPFETLQFDRRLRVRLSPRGLWLLAVGALYLLSWWLLSAGALFWLGLIAILILSWAASFAWRKALHIIDVLLHRLERM